MWIGDAQRAESHAEAKILFVAEARLDTPPLSVVVHDFARRVVAMAGGDAPRLFHALDVHANNRRDRAPCGGEFHGKRFGDPTYEISARSISC